MTNAALIKAVTRVRHKVDLLEHMVAFIQDELARHPGIPANDRTDDKQPG